MRYLKDNDLLPNLQSQYRADHLTETAMTKALSKILSTTDSGNLAMLTLLDLSAACDIVDPWTLLQRLCMSYGLEGRLLTGSCHTWAYESCKFIQLLMKLAGSTWGDSANTLRSSALVLCYSAAEYCAPVWSCSAHTSQVDVQLNSTMRWCVSSLVPSVLHLSHGFQCYPTLNHQPYEGRLPLTSCWRHDSWPIQPDILSPPLLRLTSRKPLWLDMQPVDIKSRWRHNWKSAQVVNSHLAVWLSGNALASINVVALRQTRLVLGWVTVCGRVNHFGM